jgi:hypothetical protein
MKVAGVTIFREDASIRPAIFLPHEKVPDPLHTIPILHLPVVSPYNPHSPVSRSKPRKQQVSGLVHDIFLFKFYFIFLPH